MSIQRLVISALAIIASCHASGIGHLAPVVKSFPIVRYAPFFSFPNGGRSIHAVAPAVAPAPVFPAPAPAPVFAAPAFPAPGYPAPAFPGPAFPGPAFPGPAFPGPAFPAPAFPAPAFPGPVFPAPGPAYPAATFSAPAFHASAVAPAPLPLPAPAPIHFTPQPFFAPALPRLAPLVPSLPRIASLVPSLPRLAPFVPTYSPAPVFARAVHALPAASFSPIIRPALAPALPSPVFGPAPLAVTKALPFGLPAYAPQLPYGHAPLVKEAWK